MKLAENMHWGTAVLLACSMAAFAADKGDKKDQAAPAQAIDSGSFGVFIKGQRMLTETFSVQQAAGTNIVKAELKETTGSTPIGQKSSIEMNGSGELIRYEWSQTAPSASSLQVLPQDDFLIEKVAATSSTKAAEQSFLMPSSSLMLDNNFFIHREVLAWRYLSATCHPEGGAQKCQTSPAEYGVLVPQERSSMRVRIQLVGAEKVTIHGQERELLRLNLVGEGFEWALWVDDKDHFKLMRVAIPADSTEVVRD